MISHYLTVNVDGSLCLVLALKEATTSPFLALDEPDVFMDERNRRLTIECLIRVALFPFPLPLPRHSSAVRVGKI